LIKLIKRLIKLIKRLINSISIFNFVALNLKVMTTIKKIKSVDALHTRELILETALKLFAEQGFEAVSIRAIAKNSNTNLSMISYYFGSKEKLYETILEDKIPQMRIQLQNLLDNNELNSFKKVDVMIDLYIDRVFQHRDFNKLVIREMSLMQRPEHASTIVQQIMLNWRIIIEILEEGQANGAFKKELDVRLTWTSIIGTLFQIVNNPILACALAGVNQEVDLFTPKFIERVRVHLKSLLLSHLTK
jgi:AcrR family transcriptional regulator